MKTVNPNTRSSGLPTSMPTVEPKTIVAVVLVGMMLVLWGRVMMRSKAGPASASAETLTAAVENTAKSSVRIRPIVLPMCKGRNDRIAADMFNAGSQFQSQGWGVKQPVASSGEKPSAAKLVSELTKAMVLEAVIVNALSQPEKASINGVVVSEGSSIPVMVGKEQFTMQVVKIEPRQVRLACGEYQIISKMPDYTSGQ